MLLRPLVSSKLTYGRYFIYGLQVRKDLCRECKVRDLIDLCRVRQVLWVVV